MKKIILSILLPILIAGCGSPSYKRDASMGAIDADNASKTYESDAGSLKVATTNTAAIAAGVGIIRAVTEMGKDSKSPQNQISGHCVFKSGGTETPCSSVLLILQKKDGSAFAEQRTQMDGNFLFKVRVNEEYRIVTQSSQLKSEAGSAHIIKAGSRVKIVLENK